MSYADGHVAPVQNLTNPILVLPNDLMAGLTGTFADNQVIGNWTMTKSTTSSVLMDSASGSPAPSLTANYGGGTYSSATYNFPTTSAVVDSWCISGDIQFATGSGNSYGEFHAFDSANKEIVKMYEFGYSNTSYDFNLNGSYRPYGTGTNDTGLLIAAKVIGKWRPFKITLADGKVLYQMDDIVYQTTPMGTSTWKDIKYIRINGGGPHGFTVRLDNLKFGAF